MTETTRHLAHPDDAAQAAFLAQPVDLDGQAQAALADVDDRPKFDPVDTLTIAELSAGSRELKADVIAVVTSDDHPLKSDALAVVAWLHARRHDRTTKPDALLREFRAMTYTELVQHLNALGDVDGANDPESPTAPGPA